MKRMISLLLAAAISLGVFGCSSESSNEDGAPDETIGEAETEAPETTTSETEAPATEPPSTEPPETEAPLIDLSEGSTTEFMNITTKKIDPASLIDTGVNSQRWLSVPESRLVINPYPFGGLANSVTHATYSDSPDIPLNIGYLDPYTKADTGTFLEDIILLHEGDPKGGIEKVWEADFSEGAKWVTGNKKSTSIVTDGSTLTLRVLDGASEPWQYAAQTVRKLDLDADPLITITVDSTEGNWALKVSVNGQEDIALQGDSNKPGTYSYNLKEMLGRGGKINATIKVFSIGIEKSLRISRLDIGAATENREKASEFTTAWTPYSLSFTAAYPDGLKLEGEDVFADTDTVIRNINVTSGGTLSIGGMLYGTPVSYDAGSLTVECEGYSYTIAAPESLFSEIKFYRDYLSYASGDVSDSPEGCRYYGFAAHNFLGGENFAIALSLHSDAKSVDEVAANAVKYASATEARAALDAQLAYWTEYLAKVPQPQNFELEGIDALGVTPDMTEKMYYRAWVFMAQNTLPANPEIGFNYKQICCGKPSMWGGGHPSNKYTASWESFFGMMCLGYTLPDIAWDAYIGLMSLVDDEGMLAGESLPSEKAHTGYLLYNLTGDAEKLALVYDDIAAYLKWRVENPRWIFLEHNDPNTVDADFAESALVDINYMIEIAKITGHDDDIPMWEKTYDDLLDSYRFWFFDENGKAVQYSNINGNGRSIGCTIWTTKGIYIDGLEKEYEDMIMDRWDSEYRLDKAFGGFTLIKYPDTCHTTWGLINRGYTELAAEFTELCMRDVVRSGIFAECYNNPEIPEPYGVRPSIFGCAMLIDTVLLSNGFRYEEGLPMVTNLGFDGGVTNIAMREGITSVVINSDSERVEIAIGEKTAEYELAYGATVRVK